ncbi:hypothetical protein [uncultured Paraglaciecola sp.]|uniref:hypothetical protein n=1 Tax=uncultured Paraglaciecola sp. TaxID=1765024 RepID=UPI002594D8D7|nr:hypothetical protein [uncultured Paraglaciecola sp.]
MKIEALAIATQPRNSWKSFDLGCRMAMQWWVPLYGFMLCSTLPIFIVCTLLSPEYGVYFLWLLKPWFERGLLYIHSRQVFGQQVSVVDALKAWPSQIKVYWLASITWQRLSPSRGFDLPVAQLEGLKGEKRKARLRLLHQTTDDNSYWWLLICLHWELFITFGLLMLVNMLIPLGFEWNIADAFYSESNLILIAYNVCWYFALVLIAPLFIGGGFAAYLNRRILLEGWDIELGLKKIRNRWSAKQISLLVILVAGLMGYAADAPVAYAQTNELEQVTEELATDPEEPQLSEDALKKHTAIKESLQEILAGPPFHNKEMVRDWRWTGWKWESSEPEEPADLSDWMGIFAVIAKFAEVILWVLFISIIGWLLWLSRHQLAKLLNIKVDLKKQKVDLPAFSRHEKQQGLPSDIPAELDALLEQQAYRQVLSLLLVSSLTYLYKKHDLSLTESMTELECLAEIRSKVQGESLRFMTSLIQLWIDLAWAHRWPNAEKMAELCTQWQQVFLTVEAGETP